MSHTLALISKCLLLSSKKVFPRYEYIFAASGNVGLILSRKEDLAPQEHISIVIHAFQFSRIFLYPPPLPCFVCHALHVCVTEFLQWVAEVLKCIISEYN